MCLFRNFYYKPISLSPSLGPKRLTILFLQVTYSINYRRAIAHLYLYILKGNYALLPPKAKAVFCFFFFKSLIFPLLILSDVSMNTQVLVPNECVWYQIMHSQNFMQVT